VKYVFISEESPNHSTERLCRVMGVSTSGYYDWRKRKPSAHARRDQELLVKITASFDRSHGIYGSPRIYDDLIAEHERVGPDMIGVAVTNHNQIYICYRITGLVVPGGCNGSLFSSHSGLGDGQAY